MIYTPTKAIFLRIPRKACVRLVFHEAGIIAARRSGIRRGVPRKRLELWLKKWSAKNARA